MFEEVSLSKFSVHRSAAPSEPGPPHCRGRRSHSRHTTLRSAPLDEWSAQCRDLYLTTHNTHKRQTSMPPVGFETAIPVSERPKSHALDRAATVTDLSKFCKLHALIHDDTPLNSPILSLTSFITLSTKLVQKRRHLVFGFTYLNP